MNQSCPNQVIVARDALDELTRLTAGHTKIVCVTDETMFSQYKTRMESLLENRVTWLLASEYSEDKRVGETGSLILGFGGGYSLDTAKLLAAETGLDWVSIPTAASHDGIASEAASVSQNGYRYSKKCKLPIAVVADLGIMSKAPPNLKLAGTGDILCKASSLAEWKLAAELMNEPFDQQAFDIVKSALDRVMKDDGLETLVRAEIDAGRAMCLAGSSRPCSGTEHSISHAMDQEIHSLHGLQVAFATPLCLYYLEEAGYSVYDSEYVRHVMVGRGLPSALEDMSISSEMYLHAIHHAIEIMRNRNRYSVLEGIDDDDLLYVIEKIY